ncbi:hypothetical protein NKI20_11595 [Mesorhizobium sp. M0830]|uniref:hypothetical protein n=1 Tax=Mesorhizobium sp. M0830 TaxID=2957008 RepID=UPI003339C3F3
MAGDWTEEQNEAIVADYLTIAGSGMAASESNFIDEIQLLGNPMLSQTIRESTTT